MARKGREEEAPRMDAKGYTFTALEFLAIRGAIGNWPMQVKAQQRFVDELDDLFTLTDEEKERCGYHAEPGVMTEQGLQESWRIAWPDTSIERVMDATQSRRLVRVLTAHEIQRWRKRHFDLLIQPIVDRLGGEPVEL